MSHIDLESYFRMMFAMVQYHKWSLSELENMIPIERDIYVILMKQHLEEEEEKARMRQKNTG